MCLQVPQTLGRRGAMGNCVPDVLLCLTSSPSSSSALQVGTFPKSLDQCRSITFNRFVLNMVRGQNLQLRSCPPLFCNLRQFNIKVVAAHHPIILKEVDELLAKGAFEPSTGEFGFCCNIFVVPKHTGGI